MLRTLSETHWLHATVLIPQFLLRGPHLAILPCDQNVALLAGSASKSLVNERRDAQFFIMYLFLFLTLYMFRAHRAHHQERQIVSIQPLVTVTLYR